MQLILKFYDFMRVYFINISRPQYSGCSSRVFFFSQKCPGTFSPARLRFIFITWLAGVSNVCYKRYMLHVNIVSLSMSHQTFMNIDGTFLLQ